MVSGTYLLAETLVEACDGLQEETQACEEREGRAGNNQAWTIPPTCTGQTREARNGF